MQVRFPVCVLRTPAEVLDLNDLEVGMVLLFPSPSRHSQVIYRVSTKGPDGVMVLEPMEPGPEDFIGINHRRLNSPPPERPLTIIDTRGVDVRQWVTVEGNELFALEGEGGSYEGVFIGTRCNCSFGQPIIRLCTAEEFQERGRR